ncbi:LytR C-terminal domain-containing protein [Cellulomonas sp. NS3]|uniref:LytR C-terminal domain-containing protein n=1 Tax=Cellulomonas sp. NS3 TaxID=2973977 RepID=UPI002161776B|nr:LytR C-terminal domain-containing protein [Cellulomonas sp. NS3]
MSKGSYPYPEDEFDAAEDLDGPRGVHRAPRSRWRALLPFAIVLVVFAGLGAGVLLYLANSDVTLPAGLGSGTTAGDDAGDGATEGEGDAAAGEGGEATDPAEGDAAEEPPATEPVAPAPDLASAVTVYNAAQVAGLAGETAETLTSAGFTNVDTGNHTGAGVDGTTVFYAAEAQRVTAEAVAQALGITQVLQSSTEAAAGIAVVLEADFTR